MYIKKGWVGRFARFNRGWFGIFGQQNKKSLSKKSSVNWRIKINSRLDDVEYE